MNDSFKSRLTCNDTLLDTNLLFNLSHHCLIDPDFSPDCFPDEFEWSAGVTIAEGIWCILNAVIGFFGNLLTLLAIPYAAHKNKFNLQRGWTSTKFVLNLAVADFLHCTFSFPFIPSKCFTRDGSGERVYVSLSVPLRSSMPWLSF